MVLPIKIDFPGWLSKAERQVLTLLSHLKVLWKAWDIRTLILLSLGLQVTLIILAPFRKKTSNGVVLVAIWLAYLLADYIAIFAIGLIPNNSDATPLSGYHPDLLAFWAPFLVVHLGGPDTITALALEDNELWLRTGLHLFTYMAATGRVFFQSLPTNSLCIPTIFIFFAGFLKYCERTLSMYYSRLSHLRQLDYPDPGPNYPKIMEAYNSSLHTSVPVRFDTTPDQHNVFDHPVPELSSDDGKDSAADEDEVDDVACYQSAWERLIYFTCPRDKDGRIRILPNVKLARDAYEWFELFKMLYADIVFSIYDWKLTRCYFLNPSLTPEEAFTMIAMELNFAHDYFFTKSILIHKKRGAYIRRAYYASQLVALLIWILFIDKKPFHWFDIWITYTLLLGAVTIDSVSFFMVLLSGWQMVFLSKDSKLRASLYDKLMSAHKRTWGRYWGSKECPLWPWTRRILFRRWSESIRQFNLIEYCVDDPWSDCTHLLFKVLPLMKGKCNEFKYVSKKWFADDLRDLIFIELRYRALVADDPKDIMEICQSKGGWALRMLAGLDFEPFVFYRWTVDVEYGECLLMWHIATQLLYQTSLGDLGNGEQVYRKCCNTLSDYMMYILKWQPGLMPAQASITDVRLGDTCAEATIFFSHALPKPKRGETREERLRIGCEALMSVNTMVAPRDIKGERSKSVLFDAVQLAKELTRVNDSTVTGMWELIAKVWVDLMCYSASNGKASNHAGQLKQGGELLTLVWLLMVHLGLGNNFRIT